MKKLFKILLLSFSPLFIVACEDKNNEKEQEVVASQKISGVVRVDETFGSLEPNFTAKDMIEAGFEYGDLLSVKIGDLPTMIVPFVTAYTEAGNMGLCCCDYGAKGETVVFGIANGNFKKRVGGNDNDSITITMQEKGGYLDKYNLVRSVYTNNRSDYPSDEAFANFREVTTTGIGKGKIYRSSNPLNCEKNPVRYIYADSLAKKAGIKTEIDLADTDEDIKRFISSENYQSTYCPELFNEGNLIALSMNADVFSESLVNKTVLQKQESWDLDMFSESFMKKTAKAMRFMIEHDAPYLIHCTEGKDRCGFICMILEALAGSSIEEIRTDYMVTFENYYKFVRGTEAYNLNLSLTGDRTIWVLNNPSVLDDYVNINWDNVSLEGINIQDASLRYLKKCGLTDEECNQLKQKISE